MLWVMPLPANIVLRNFGLALFLATVGVNAGQPFVQTVSQTGPTLLLIGVAVLLTTVAIVLLMAKSPAAAEGAAYRYQPDPDDSVMSKAFQDAPRFISRARRNAIRPGAGCRVPMF